jgi:beta-phosphoglucomutase-like phosphatase (HAD superfamily)
MKVFGLIFDVDGVIADTEAKQFGFLPWQELQESPAPEGAAIRL